MPFVIPQVLNMMNVLMVHVGIHGIYTYIFTYMYMYLNNLYIHLIISNSIESRKFFGYLKIENMEVKILRNH